MKQIWVSYCNILIFSFGTINFDEVFQTTSQFTEKKLFSLILVNLLTLIRIPIYWGDGKICNFHYILITGTMEGPTPVSALIHVQ